MAYVQDPIKEKLRAIGENIKAYRKQRRLTLEGLGLDIGLDKAGMHRIESGKNITLATLIKISVFLEVDLPVLVDTNVNVPLEAAEKYIRTKKNDRKKKK